MDDAEDPVIECHFFIPLVRNSDKAPHQQLAWNALDDALYSRFGGSTCEQIYQAVRPLKGQYQGGGGERIRDESFRYLTALPTSRVDELRGLLRRAANTFDQECIYFSVRGAVEYVEAAPETGFLTDE